MWSTDLHSTCRDIWQHSGPALLLVRLDGPSVLCRHAEHHCCTACRNIRQYPEAGEEAGLLLVRLDAPLYFANVQYVRDRLRKYELRSQVTCGNGRA
jgi:MFS superfamily sulfate permease-like transporter